MTLPYVAVTSEMLWLSALVTSLIDMGLVLLGTSHPTIPFPATALACRAGLRRILDKPWSLLFRNNLGVLLCQVPARSGEPKPGPLYP